MIVLSSGSLEKFQMKKNEKNMFNEQKNEPTKWNEIR